MVSGCLWKRLGGSRMSVTTPAMLTTDGNEVVLVWGEKCNVTWQRHSETCCFCMIDGYCLLREYGCVRPPRVLFKWKGALSCRPKAKVWVDYISIYRYGRLMFRSELKSTYFLGCCNWFIYVENKTGISVLYGRSQKLFKLGHMFPCELKKTK